MLKEWVLQVPQKTCKNAKQVNLYMIYRQNNWQCHRVDQVNFSAQNDLVFISKWWNPFLLHEVMSRHWSFLAKRCSLQQRPSYFAERDQQEAQYHCRAICPLYEYLRIEYLLQRRSRSRSRSESANLAGVGVGVGKSSRLRLRLACVGGSMVYVLCISIFTERQYQWL